MHVGGMLTEASYKLVGAADRQGLYDKSGTSFDHPYDIELHERLLRLGQLTVPKLEEAFLPVDAPLGYASMEALQAMCWISRALSIICPHFQQRCAWRFAATLDDWIFSNTGNTMRLCELAARRSTAKGA